MRDLWFAVAFAACGPTARSQNPDAGKPFLDAACATTCSTDLRQAIDCQGNVVQTCAASDQCDTSAGQCTNACAAAESNHRSVGCDYYATYMDAEMENYCFAAFV